MLWISQDVALRLLPCPGGRTHAMTHTHETIHAFELQMERQVPAISSCALSQELTRQVTSRLRAQRLICRSLSYQLDMLQFRG